MKKRVLVAYCVAVATMMGCSNDISDNPAIDDTPTPLRDITLSRGEEAISNAQTEFAYRLIREVAASNEGENWVISPFATFANLSMMANGVSDSFLPEVSKALCYPEGATLGDINSYIRKMTGELMSLDNQVALTVAHSNWLDVSLCKPVPEYSSVAEEYYGAPVRTCNLDADDLARNPSNPLNKWLSGGLGFDYKFPANPGEILVSVSPTVVSFSGKWAVPFDPKDTSDKEFRNYSGTVTKVPMMNHTIANGEGLNGEDEYRCGYMQGAEFLDISYGNGAYFVRICLPKNDLTEFVRNLKYERYNASFYVKKISIPKFELRNEFKLDKQLENIGMGCLFGKSHDNVNRLDNFYTLNEKLDGLHTFVHNDNVVRFSIDESGAAMASADIMSSGVYSSSLIPPQRREYFTVDRPFFFMVIEKSTRTIMTAGAVYKLGK